MLCLGFELAPFLKRTEFFLISGLRDRDFSQNQLSEADACLILSVFICERLQKLLDYFFFVFKLRLRTKVLRDVSVRGSVFCVFVEKFCLTCWRSDWFFERPRLEWKHNEKLLLFAFFKLPWCFKWNRQKMEKALEAACRMISDVWWLWERFPWADVAADAQEIDWPVAWVCLEYLTRTVS